MVNRRFQKYNCFQGGPNFGGGTARKFRENGQSIVMQINFEREYFPLTPGIKLLAMPQIFLRARPNFKQK